MSQLIFGRNPVIEALKAELSVEKIFLLHGVHGRSIQTIRSLARNQKIPLEEVDRQRWGQLGGTEKAQGIIALLSEIPAFELGDILQRAKERGEAPLIALVDGIEDPRNLGAIIRSAEGAGFHGLIMPKRRAVGLTETVVRTSAGALAHLPVAKVTNLVPVIEQLKNSGLWIGGADQSGETLYYEADLSGPLGIVIGGEGKGLRRLVKEKCDFLVRIPLKGKVNSLNASVAAAILFFEAQRQRDNSFKKHDTPIGV